MKQSKRNTSLVQKRIRLSKLPPFKRHAKVSSSQHLINVLKQNRGEFGMVVNANYRTAPVVIFDFSERNKILAKINVSNPKDFARYISKTLTREGKLKIGIGKYNEECTTYRSDLFTKTHRTVHIGIDITVPQGTKILCPFKGKVHSFKNNNAKGDYGPTIVLEHELEGIKFYTLYGHLSLGSIKNLKVGQVFGRGNVMGAVGSYSINGGWPPHLHFQIIKDMLGNKGDFPGACSLEKRKQFLDLCPNPNLILQIKGL